MTLAMSRVQKIQSMVRERRRALKETNSVKLSRMEDLERHDFTGTVSTNATRNLSTGRKMAKNIAKCAVITTSVRLGRCGSPVALTLSGTLIVLNAIVAFRCMFVFA